MVFARFREALRRLSDVESREAEGRAEVARTSEALSARIAALERAMPDADSAIVSRFLPLERDLALLAERVNGAVASRLEAVEATVKELRERKGADPDLLQRVISAETEAKALRVEVKRLNGRVSKDPEFTPPKKEEPARAPLPFPILGGPGWGEP